MRILLITPDARSHLIGNRITAVRYARIFRRLGHRVRMSSRYDRDPCDLAIALHARRSSAAIRAFRRAQPDLPLILVLTGTDLYRDIHSDGNARQSLSLATRLVVLQRKGLEELPAQLRERTHVIYQSARKTRGSVSRPSSYFKVAVIGHLRDEKDPWRAAEAARLLPPDSRLRVVQVGRALERAYEKRALREQAENPRYRWAGELPHWKALRVLASSHLLAVTSRMEGGCNVLGEALAAGVPVAASRISGLIGMLGESYPGYYPPGDTDALAALLSRAETDAPFYASLKAGCARAAPLVQPAREARAWKELFRDLGRTGRKR